ncbi:hypothetical protein SK128_021523 [Halocaridina rubra]|uniref:Uncharacterized protein n=1 Tax=Halocaridina rubra TaxID=373956 RepID=A0AAN9A6A3_HALRR
MPALWQCIDERGKRWQCAGTPRVRARAHTPLSRGMAKVPTFPGCLSRESQDDKERFPMAFILRNNKGIFAYTWPAHISYVHTPEC